MSTSKYEPTPVVPFYIDKFPAIPRPPFEAHQRGTIDVRHLLLIRSILGYGAFGPGRRFRRVAEIGCFEGFSSMALLDAVRAGECEEVYLCDIRLDEHLKAEMELSDALVHFSEASSVRFLRCAPALDFVFVDGCHEKEVVKVETEILIDMGPVVVMAHDTNSENLGHPGCDGPPFLKAAFMQDPRYYCLEDNRKRPRETTDKGMFFATQDPELFRFAKEKFAFWDTAEIDPKFLPFQ